VDLTGERIGPYEVVEPLGRGGMGTVYRAVGDDGKSVAIKVLHPHLISVKGAFKRFMREAKLGQAIDHPCVVRTLDVDAWAVGDQQINFLVLEYIEGQNLEELIKELGSVPEELCRLIGRQVADALCAVHAAGAIHRDLKPANVIITPDNEVKLMDLGIAMLVEQSMKLTGAGEFLGSILYAAPEQWNPEATIDGRIDIFALGILLYELATGRHPFAANREGPPSLLAARPAEPANLTRPELSSFFVEFVAKLLSVDPDDRFGSAEVTHGVLEAGERSQWWRGHEVELDRTGQVRARRIQVPRDARVQGRDAELATIAEAMAKVREGHGQVVLVEGESGIGKTRLIDEFLRLDQEPLQLLFGSYPPGGAATAEGAFSTAFREHFGRADLESKLGPIMPELTTLVPAFAALLRGEAAPSEHNRLTAESVVTVFTEATRAIAGHEPVVLFLDDLHFAPSEARALFSRLAHAIRELPVMLVGAYRPDAAGEWTAGLRSLPNTTHVVLGRLAPKELAVLLADALGSAALADQLGWEIARKSDGNPLFVFEILRDLRERKQLLRQEDGSYRTTGLIRQIDTPHTVRELIHSRLRKLDDHDRDLLDVAACCGYRFDPAVVAQAAGMDLIPALKRFRKLERDHSILRADGREYAFDHHQMQEAIYDDLFEQLKEQYHATIGDSLEQQWKEPTDEQVVTLCEHFLKGGQGARTAPYLRRAIMHLRSGNLYESVARMSTMAREAGQPTDPEERFEILDQAANAASMACDWETEKALCDEMTELAEQLGDARRLRALINQATHLYGVSEFEDAIAAYAKALELAEAQGNVDAQHSAQRGLGISYSRRGESKLALAHAQKSLEYARTLGARAAEAAAHNNIAIQYMDIGDPDKAEEHYRQAIDAAHECGEQRWEANTMANWGRVHFERGNYDEAWRCASRFRELTRIIGDRRGEATSGVIMGTLWMLFGAIEEMEHELERFEDWLDEARDRWLLAYVIRQRGWIAEQRGENEKAKEFYERALAIRREIGDLNTTPDTLIELGALHIRMGEPETGRPMIEEALTLEGADAAVPAFALSELCVADPSRVDEARAALAELAPKGTLSVGGPYGIWRATGDRADLEAAYRALEDLESRIPEEYHRSARERVWKFRAVVEAWNDQGNRPVP
jgi:tetratricopeptide (TPR) repeat protein